MCKVQYNNFNDAVIAIIAYTIALTCLLTGVQWFKEVGSLNYLHLMNSL